MKNLLITISLFLTSIYLAAQSQSIEWQKCLGGTLADQAYSIRQTTDGGFIVTGRSISNDGDVSSNHGGYDCWAVKLTNTGVIEWQKSLGGTGDDVGVSIDQTDDEGYIVAGISNSTDGDVTGNHSGNDYWVVKLTNTGVIEWQKSLGGSGDDYVNSIQQTSDKGYIVVGSSNSTDGDVTGNYGGYDYWVVKLDSIGTIVWQKCLGGTGVDEAKSIYQTVDGGFVVVGLSNSTDGDVTGNHGNGDYWVVKLSITGTIEWQKSLGGTGQDLAYSIQQTTDGGYIIAGFSESNDGDITNHHGDAFYSDFWIVKLSNTGNIDWQKSLGGTLTDVAHFIQQTNDGGYIVAGYTDSYDEDVTIDYWGSEYWVVKLNSIGNFEWQKSLGGTDNERAHSIQQTDDGGYIVAGYSTSNDIDVSGNNGFYDFWVVKLSSTVGVNTITELNDFSVYPNPTSNQITLKANNQLIGAFYTIYDNMGKTVISGQINAPQMLIELGNLSDGIYLLSIGEHKQSFKVIKN